MEFSSHIEIYLFQLYGNQANKQTIATTTKIELRT